MSWNTTGAIDKSKYFVSMVIEKVTGDTHVSTVVDVLLGEIFFFSPNSLFF